MKRKIIFGIIIFTVLILAGCGETESRRDSHRYDNDITGSYDAENSEGADAAKGNSDADEISLDERHFRLYNEEFMASENYDPLFENRCMYIDGNRVYIPATVRQFENLLGIKFVEVDRGAMGGWAYKTDDNRILKVNITVEDREKLTGDDSFDESKDVSICGFVYCDKTYKDSRDIWCDMDVRFEEVGRECVNEYGYYFTASPYEGATAYRYYLPCYQAYYEYINGTIPSDVFNDDAEYSMQEIVEYSQGEGYVKIAFGDVTCDAVDEMIIRTDSDYYPDGFRECKVFTYDTVDKRLGEIEYIDCDIEPTVGRSDSIDCENGMLVFSTRMDNSSEQSEYREYSIYNRYGYSWRYLELRSRYDKTLYEWAYTINGNEVSKEEYENKKKSLRHGATYFETMDRVLDELSSKATLAAVADYSGDNNLTKVDLKKAIEEIDLISIGYDANRRDDDEIDADFTKGDGELMDGEYSIDGASFPGNEKALNEYRSFLKGRKKGSDGRSINDYLNEQYESVYFYYIKSPGSEDYALVINYSDASSHNDIYFYENGEVTYKAYFGRHAMGASYLYNDEYIIWDTNSGCTCMVATISHLDENYNEVEVANLFLERGEGCTDPSHEHGFDNFVDMQTYGIDSGESYVNNVLGVYGETTFDLPSNAVRIK